MRQISVRKASKRKTRRCFIYNVPAINVSNITSTFCVVISERCASSLRRSALKRILNYKNLLYRVSDSLFKSTHSLSLTFRPSPSIYLSLSIFRRACLALAHLRFDLIPRLLRLFRRITRFGFFAAPLDVTVPYIYVCTIYRASSWFYGLPSKARASRSLFSAI